MKTSIQMKNERKTRSVLNGLCYTGLLPYQIGQQCEKNRDF